MEKKLNLELMRIFASFLVITNHLFDMFIFTNQLSKTWLLSIILLCISKSAVPVFFMVSGVLLLRKEYSWKQIIKKICRILFILLIFTLFYFYFDPALKETQLTFWKGFLSGSFVNAFWYLYSYLALLLILPFLKKMVTNFTLKDYHIFFILMFSFTTFIPFFLSMFEFNLSDDFSRTLFSPYLLYFIFGHYFWNIKQCKTRFKTHTILIMYLLSVIFSIWLFKFFYINNLNIALINNRATSFNWAFMSITIFIFLSKLNLTYKKLNDIIRKISKNTFGIYLLSDFFIRLSRERVYNFSISHNFKPIISIFFLNIIIFFFGVLSVSTYHFILKNLKILSKKIYVKQKKKQPRTN